MIRNQKREIQKERGKGCYLRQSLTVSLLCTANLDYAIVVYNQSIMYNCMQYI